MINLQNYQAPQNEMNNFVPPQNMIGDSLFPQDTEMSYDKENQALAFMSHNQDQGLMDLLTINSQDEAATTEDEHHITETESRTSQNTATSYMTTPLVTPIESIMTVK